MCSRSNRRSLRRVSTGDFSSKLERQLCSLNIEYEAKRKSLRLQDPVLHVMRRGWYERQKKALVADGKRLFQAKTILLEVREEPEGSSQDVIAVVELAEK